MEAAGGGISRVWRVFDEFASHCHAKDQVYDGRIPDREILVKAKHSSFKDSSVCVKPADFNGTENGHARI